MEAKRSTGVWLLAGIAALGLALRLYRLDALGLTGNEDYLAIAVRRVLAGGLPEFPSGVLYPRALPLTYLTAGLASLLGTSELVLRLPSVCFSTLSIAAVYLLARRLTSTPVALLAALLVALSDWEIQVGRTARMYSMLSLGCLLSVGLLDRALDRRRWGPGVAAAAAAAITCWTHQLGAALMVMFSCFLLHFELDRTRIRLLAACLLVAALSAGSYFLFTEAQYRQWDAAVEAVRGAAWEDAPDVRAPLGRELSERYLEPWRSLRRGHAGLFAGLTIVALGALAGLGIAAWRRPRERLFTAAAGLLVVTLYLQQLALAAIVVGLYVAVGRRRQPEVYRARSGILVALLAAAGAAWLLFALLAVAPEPSSAASLLKRALKPLVGYPPSFFRIYLEQYPALSALALCASAVAAGRYLRDGCVDRLGLLVLLFAAPLLLIGFHPQAIGRMAERYVFFLDPFFLALAAYGAIWIGQRLWERLGRRGLLRVPVVAGYVALLVAVTGFANLRPSLALVSAEYGLDPDLRDRKGIERRHFHPDLAGPARFVQAELEPPDVVVAMDVLGTYAYLPHADYQLTLFGKPDAEGWLGARSLESAAALAEALERHRCARVWIVLSATHLRWFADDPRMDAILGLVRERAGAPRYRGRDGLSDVFLVKPRPGGCDGGRERSSPPPG